MAQDSTITIDINDDHNENISKISDTESHLSSIEEKFEALQARLQEMNLQTFKLLKRPHTTLKLWLRFYRYSQVLTLCLPQMTPADTANHPPQMTVVGGTNGTAGHGVEPRKRPSSRVLRETEAVLGEQEINMCDEIFGANISKKRKQCVKGGLPKHPFLSIDSKMTQLDAGSIPSNLKYSEWQKPLQTGACNLMISSYMKDLQDGGKPSTLATATTAPTYQPQTINGEAQLYFA